ncbi:hypothetical protein JTE90_003290 [Oedothorax gibbosus]|uniref:Uncharacterized protein n=1 Tax=Oedothorax gibbosus TaxID=931172 RepID=A0AAV6V6H7_9ARAC|nr:hypothetical protein JTE90_003290 [Oedothorax gibbosus]
MQNSSFLKLQHRHRIPQRKADKAFSSSKRYQTERGRIQKSGGKNKQSRATKYALKQFIFHFSTACSSLQIYSKHCIDRPRNLTRVKRTSVVGSLRGEVSKSQSRNCFWKQNI